MILKRLFESSESSLEKAVRWVKNNRVPGSGIKVHHKTKNVSQEVTGYLITSLYNTGEKALALDLTSWEASVQRPDGSFVGPGTDVPYTFDTAQVLRGFLTVAQDHLSHMEAPVRKACNFVVSQIEPSGRITTPNADLWALPDGSKLSEYCNLFCIPPLRDAGKKYNIQKYGEAADRALNYYKSKPDLVEFKPQLGTLSHIFGYMMEALADLGEHDLAKKGLDQAARIQKGDGAVPAYPGVDWVCSTGMAQLGLAWHKTGNHEQARRMLDYLEKIQNPSGGFYGSYGPGGQYFAQEEISWANKFFIDLYLLVKGKNG
jgi:malonyl-CoA O-methyltransferase